MRNNKKLLPVFIIGVPVLAVLVVLGIVFIPGLFNGGNYLLTEDAVSPFQRKEKIHLLSKSGVVKEEFESKILGGEIAVDGSCAYFIDETDSLWFTDGKKLKKVAENVASVIPALNKTAAFLDKDRNLYLASEASKTKVAEEVDALETVSPDGKAAGYGRGEKTEATAYYYDGKEHEVGKDFRILALSEGGKYVYFTKRNAPYTSANNALYVQTGEDAESRRKIASSYDLFLLNLSGTQIFVSGTAAGSYICEDGKEALKISPDVLMPILPMSCARRSYSASSFPQLSLSSFSIVGCRDFKKACFARINEDSASVVRLDKDLQMTTIVKKIHAGFMDQCWLLDDGKTLLFIKNEDLYQIDIMKKDAEAEKLIKDISGMPPVSYDGSSLIYMDEDNCLVYLERGKEARTVFEDMPVTCVPVGRSGFLILSDAELWYTDGGKASRVKGFGSDVNMIQASGTMLSLSYGSYPQHSFYVLVTCEEAVYITADGKSFAKVISLEDDD